MLVHVGTKGVTTIGQVDGDGNVVRTWTLNWDIPVLSAEAFGQIVASIQNQKKAIGDELVKAAGLAQPAPAEAPAS